MKNNFAFILWIAATELCGQSVLVKPYIQPGSGSNFNREEKTVIWQTDATPGNFVVEYTSGDFQSSSKIMTAKVSNTPVISNEGATLLYHTTLKKLEFGETYAYRVSLNGKAIYENSFKARLKNGPTRFVAFGDCGRGTPDQLAIARQVWKQDPDFVLILGDVVYTRGLQSEYRSNYFPYYNIPLDSSNLRSSLMSSIPFYSVVGNHDMLGYNLDKYRDGLAYFLYNDLPLNAPPPAKPLPLEGSVDLTKSFKKSAGKRFPNMSNFSFDYGNVHVICLDANDYINPLDPVLITWMKTDLAQTKATWKIVAYHHPGFNTSKAHYDDQWMRLLDPQFQEWNINLVLTGHVHNYQRSVPIKFIPELSEDKTHYIISKEGRVDGDFTLDTSYDGKTNTKPKGIIYIVSGAGGAPLYDPEISDNPALWKHDIPGNWAPFTVKLISNEFSFSVIETTEEKLIFKQLNSGGTTIDEIVISKN